MTIAPVQLPIPLRLLVVDDSRAIQAIVKRAIANCGYSPLEVQTAQDGEQALDLIEQFKPDLVITDWHMPKVSGLEMVQALRQMGHENIRVGFVTTERTPSMLEEAISNGALFILHKPFNDAELAAVVHNAVKDLAQQITSAMNPRKAKTESALAEPDAPLSHSDMQLLLVNHLGNVPFRLIPNEKLTLDKLTTNNLLGLYAAAGRKGVYAVGIMDSNAVCMVGGGSARMQPPHVRAVMETGNPDPVMLDKASDFLRSASVCLQQAAMPTRLDITLSKVSVVQKTFAKLAEITAQDGQRSDYRIAIPGYGEGRMAFFVVKT